MNPEVGEIWCWMDGPPVLLLRLEEVIDNEHEFLVLDLTTEQRYSMFFGPQLGDRWRQLA